MHARRRTITWSWAPPRWFAALFQISMTEVILSGHYRGEPVGLGPGFAQELDRLSLDERG